MIDIILDLKTSRSNSEFRIGLAELTAIHSCRTDQNLKMVTNDEKPGQMHFLPGRLGLGLLEPAQASKNDIISSEL